MGICHDQIQCKAKTSSEAICETVGKALWVSIVARTDSYNQKISNQDLCICQMAMQIVGEGLALDITT